MQLPSDAQWIRDYAAHGSEPAFAGLVARHTNLIYSAALRQTGSPELAREIAQSVFTDLARKAPELVGRFAPEASLAGWLYRGTRFATLTRLRDERRRASHERQFMEHFHPAAGAANPGTTETAAESAPDWQQVAPVLDEAMAELGDADREAVLLRYFQNQDFQAVARALGVSEAAAQKRVSRAVERLRESLAQRGVTAGAQGLVVLIAAQAVLVAPAGLSAAIVAAVAGITAVTTGTATIITMSWLNAKSAAAILAAALIVGTGAYFVQERKLARAETRQRELTDEQAQLTAARDTALAAAQAKNQEADKLRADAADLARLRNEVTQLRQQVAAAKQRPPAAVPQPPTANAAAPAPGQFISKDQLAFAGYATPEAAVQSLVWAMQSGDFTAWTNLFSTPRRVARARSRDDADAKDRADFEVGNREVSASFKGLQILAHKNVRDEVVEIATMTDGFGVVAGQPSRETNVFIVIKEGNDWKMVDSHPYTADWEQRGTVQKFVP